MISKLQIRNITYGFLFLFVAFVINSCSDLGNPVDPPPPPPPGFDSIPILDSIGAQYAVAGNTFEIVITASDDNPTLTLTTSLPLPSGASFADSGNGIGVFTWVTTLADSVASISFFATDSAGQVASETISITVVGQTFDNYVNPLLQTTGCAATNCHGTNPASGFSVASYASVLAGGTFTISTSNVGIAPGRPDSSIVYLKLTANPPFGGRMPQSGPFFSDQRLDSIRLWILAGAPQS